MRTDHRTSERVAVISRLAGIGAWELDLTTDRLFMSEDACRICCVKPMPEWTLSEFGNCVASPARMTLQKSLQACHETGESWALALPLAGTHSLEETSKEQTHGDTSSRNSEDEEIERVRWARFAAEPERDANGTIVAVVGIVQDISQRKWEQADLDARHERLETALVNSNVGLWDWNAATNEVYFSPTAKQQLGYSGDEPWTTFQDWESRLHPEDRPAALTKVQAYLAGELDEYRSTFRLQCADGHYIWILSTGRGTFTEDGTAWRLAGVHMDVTEQIEVERALQRRNDELNQFAFVVSHDLQAPLKAVVGFADFLVADYGEQLDETAHSYIELIIDGCNQMRELISDLLNYSKVGSNRQPPKLVNLNVVIDEIVESLGPIIQESSGSVVRSELPECWGDRTQLMRLFQNLISNGLKYRSEKTPKISVSAELQADHWRFVVSDNGLGISLEDQKKIFDVFQRLHSSDDYPGTGIGLAICRKIVDEHGGHIWVESHVGQGSRFCFTLPAHSPVQKSFDNDILEK